MRIGIQVRLRNAQVLICKCDQMKSNRNGLNEYVKSAKLIERVHEQRNGNFFSHHIGARKF